MGGRDEPRGGTTARPGRGVAGGTSSGAGQRARDGRRLSGQSGRVGRGARQARGVGERAAGGGAETRGGGAEAGRASRKRPVVEVVQAGPEDRHGAGRLTWPC